MNGIEKSAAILSLLGDELSHKILGYLPESDAISIINASENLKTPTRETLLEIVSEFNNYMSNPENMPSEAATSGEGEEASALPANTPLEMITAASPENLTKALQEERPEIAAYVLSHLPVEKIYEVLQMLGDMRGAVESRLISIKDVPMAKELEEKVLNTISARLS